MNSSNIPKLATAREWAAYQRRLREREWQAARVLAARYSPEERAARLEEAQRNNRHGFAVAYPCVGIQYAKKSRIR